MSEKKRIVVVEDDTSIQEVIHLMLEEKGFTVHIHQDGERIILGNFEPPQLFIIDKQLPGIDGLEVCRFLKQREATQHIPVLILSASPLAAKAARSAGADSFLEKPFRMQELRDTVTKLTGY